MAEYFALGMIKELKREYFQGFSDQAMEMLSGYAWPGNLRELRNVVERAVYRNDPEEPIEVIEFDPFESPYRPLEMEVVETLDPEDAGDLLPEPAEAGGNEELVSLPDDFKEHIRRYEAQLISTALEKYRFNQRKTAQALGLSYDQFRRYLQKYALPT